jgi:hypothetical protein
MSPADTSRLIERLPPELLEKVWAFTSVPDLLRMKQVRGLYDRVQRFQLNLLDIVSLARFLVVSTISSRNRLTPSTESISMLRGWRTTPT